MIPKLRLSHFGYQSVLEKISKYSLVGYFLEIQVSVCTWENYRVETGNRVQTAHEHAGFSLYPVQVCTLDFYSLQTRSRVQTARNRSVPFVRHHCIIAPLHHCTIATVRICLSATPSTKHSSHFTLLSSPPRLYWSNVNRSLMQEWSLNM